MEGEYHLVLLLTNLHSNHYKHPSLQNEKRELDKDAKKMRLQSLLREIGKENMVSTQSHCIHIIDMVFGFHMGALSSSRRIGDMYMHT